MMAANRKHANIMMESYLLPLQNNEDGMGKLFKTSRSHCKCSFAIDLAFSWKLLFLQAKIPRPPPSPLSVHCKDRNFSPDFDSIAIGQLPRSNPRQLLGHIVVQETLPMKLNLPLYLKPSRSVRCISQQTRIGTHNKIRSSHTNQERPVKCELVLRSLHTSVQLFPVYLCKP